MTSRAMQVSSHTASVLSQHSHLLKNNLEECWDVLWDDKNTHTKNNPHLFSPIGELTVLLENSMDLFLTWILLFQTVSSSAPHGSPVPSSTQISASVVQGELGVLPGLEKVQRAAQWQKYKIGCGFFFKSYSHAIILRQYYHFCS